MNYTVKELNKYGITISDKEIELGLIQLGHEVEEVIDLNIPNLVVGEVISCEKHPDADKLSITQVNIGSETLQIVCGADNVRVGLKVIVAPVNTRLEAVGLTIKPVELKGVTSNGMLCSLSELGLSKAVLNSSDIEGICELPASAPIGENACQYLGLDDKIIDVSLTADRGDCQNYAGVVNDLSAYIKNTEGLKANDTCVNLWTSQEQTYCGIKQVTAKVLATDTIYYSLQLIEGVNVTKSPIQEQIFLMKNNVKPQNNIVDNSNYGLLTYGLPTHAFDADTIVGDVIVCKTDKVETFIGLDQNEYQLSENTLVIRDSEKIIAVAGVMGSEATKITTATKNVLFEVAIFDPSSVRLAAKNLGFKTDASIRYEKGVNYDAINVVRSKLVSNFLGTANAPYVAIDTKPQIKQIKLNYSSIKKVLGITIERQTVKSILNDLQFNCLEEDDESITYEIPNHRHDIDFEHDLVEEVIRVYGIDKIEIDQTLPGFNKIKKVNKDDSIEIERKLETLLLGTGLSQVVTYSLTSEEKLGLFAFDLAKPVKLAYPISNERSVYRQSLVNSLIETAKYNLDRQAKYSAIFEIANTYQMEGDNFIQNRYVSGLLTGELENQYLGAKRKFDFYDLKAIVQTALTPIVGELRFDQADLQLEQLNKYASAKVYAKEQFLGYIASVHPAFVKKAKHPFFVFELNFDTITEIANLKPNYKPVTTAPTTNRDFTITVGSDVSLGHLLTILEDVKYINDVKLIDIYEGEHIENGKKACTINITFGQDNITLTSEMVDAQVAKIINNIESAGFEFNK